jgi:hypothetical protein
MRQQNRRIALWRAPPAIPNFPVWTRGCRIFRKLDLAWGALPPERVLG